MSFEKKISLHAIADIKKLLIQDWRAEFKSEKADFMPDKVNFRSVRADFKPHIRLDFLRVGWTDVWMRGYSS